MKRKFVNAILFGALIAASTSVVQSCKDYDDDISDLQSQITNNALFRSGMRKTKNDIWKEHGTCQYCGGSFDGLLIKKCSRCGRTKDY